MTYKANIIFNKLAMYDTSIGDYWDYFKNLVEHKVDVYKAGRDFSAPRLSLIAHDWDKFFPKMFKRYAEWFNGPMGRTGTRDPLLRQEWGLQVEAHKERSAHHHPENFEQELEAVADWYSASKRSAGNPPDYPPVEDWLRGQLYSLNVSDYTKQYLSNYL
ncbi:MAG TPA: DUF5662 family protein [Bacteroidales bacterium]|nr:DUF5662 family protein [Bacteroidales bacterium]